MRFVRAVSHRPTLRQSHPTRRTTGWCYRSPEEEPCSPRRSQLIRNNGSVKVFLSYVSADAAVARDVARVLESEQFSVMTAADVAEPGEAWPAAVDRAIEQADVVLMLLSNSTRSSSWIDAEAAFALADAQAKPHKRVIPLFLARPGDVIPPFLAHIQGVDLRLPDRQARLRRLAATLRVPPPTVDDRAIGVSTALERMNQVLDSDRFFEALAQRQRSVHSYRWLLLWVFLAGATVWIDVFSTWRERLWASPLSLVIAFASVSVALVTIHVVGRKLDYDYGADEAAEHPPREESPQ